MQEDKTICPHCHTKMKKWKIPAFSTWTAEYFYVCFNDECSYFVRGWEHMDKSLQAGCSYRHRYDPETGQTGPLPVWSKEALKDCCLTED
jgi:hypothetical protein